MRKTQAYPCKGAIRSKKRRTGTLARHRDDRQECRKVMVHEGDVQECPSYRKRLVHDCGWDSALETDGQECPSYGEVMVYDGDGQECPSYVLCSGIVKRLAVGLVLLCVSGLVLPSSAAEGVPAARTRKENLVREILVPFEDLNVLLEGDVRRVFLTRQQYDELLAEARRTDPQPPAPHSALILAAEYDAVVEDGRALLSGVLDLEILDDGLQAIPLDLGGVGVREARLDDRPAAMGRNEHGQAVLLAAGRGRHRLSLDLVSPLETSAAQQSLSFRLPAPPAARLRLTVPGNVELKSGASAVSREVDADAGVTRFELLLPREQTSLVLSLNNRMLQRQRVIVARSVLVDEVTAAYERLHATVSFGILHGAADRFRFVLPEGFEPTEVFSPLLARWHVHAAEGQEERQLEVVLREPATGTVVLNLSATRTPARLSDWSLPRLQPLDVDGQVAVVGLIVEQPLKAQSLSYEGLIPLDNAVLAAALPETVFRTQPGMSPVRAVAAYYAPAESYRLQARFARPAARLEVDTHLLLVIEDTGLRVHGGFTVMPEVEPLFELRFRSPPGWYVSEVTGEDRNPLAVERFEDADGQLLRVRLAQAVAPGESAAVLFHAQHVPAGWLGNGDRQPVEFPRFAAVDADRDSGAIAIRAGDDLAVRPDELDGVMPLDENEKGRYGLADIASDLAYRYDAQPYRTTLVVSRQVPELTARSYCFLRLAPAVLSAHYEVVYEIRQGRARRLSLVLPPETPASLAIRGLDGVVVKESGSEELETGRRWTVLLAEPARGVVRLAVDFQQPLGQQRQEVCLLPLPRVEGVSYQTLLVAIEGHADLDLEPQTAARRVDVGELAAAQYRPGRRLLGVYEFIGAAGDLRVDIHRRDGYGLPPAIVERAELVTSLSASGASQTAARYHLRTRAPFLEIRLPEGAALWSAHVDGKSMAPQTDRDSLLISLPASGSEVVRDLQIVYETPVQPVRLAGRVTTAAPRLLLRDEREAPPREVPAADVIWHLVLPTGHRVVRSQGTVSTDQLLPRRSPVWTVAGVLYWMGGGAGRPVYHAAREARVRRPSASRMLAEPAAEMEYPAADGMYGLAGEELEEGGYGGGGYGYGAADPFLPSPMLADPAAPADMPQSPDQPMAQAAPQSRASGLGRGERATAARAKTELWALEGVRSLQIDVQQQGDRMSFRSLGASPQIAVILINQARVDYLAWGVAALVLVLGIALSGTSARSKTAYVMVVAFAALTTPLLTGLTHELGAVFDAAFYAACLLVPYYLLVGLAGWLLGRCCRWCGRPVTRGARLAAILLAGCLSFQPPAPAAAQDGSMLDAQWLVELLAPPAPIELPEDAVIIPYDPDDGVEGLSSARTEQVLVPYAKYVELWNRAYPSQRLETAPPVVPYGLAGAAYEASLSGDEYLELRGQLDIEVFSDQEVQIPLPLQGGVLASARLDGQPARLQVVQPVEAPGGGTSPQQQAQAAPPGPTAPVVCLLATGKGLKRLELTVRIKLVRRGGWREVAGRIPVAPAARLTLSVPSAGTEIRLAGLPDRREYETTGDAERIVAALPASGELRLQWRPKVAEGQVDRSLTVESEAVLDVQEDGLRLTWQMQLQFPRSRRDSFRILVPAGYLVERVTGDNVRGWEFSDQQPPRLDVTLLQESVDTETIMLHLSQRGGIRADAPTEVQVPVVTVDGASLEKGRLTIRRSPLIDLRAEKLSGVSRTDVSATAVMAEIDAAEASPLRLQAFQAYHFAATPFALQLTAVPIPGEATVEVQTLLRIAERETTLESHVVVQPGRRPVHRVRMYLPQALRIERIEPSPLEWAIAEEDQGQRLLSVYLDTGRVQPFSLVLTGSLGRREAGDPVAVPRFQLLDVVRQQGDVVVQVDPAFNVRAAELNQCETILLSRTFGWLQESQRALARLALRYENSDWNATLAISPRRPQVTGFTVTNVKVTNIAVEETIVIDLTIRDAGIREVVFLLPAGMDQARIQAPLLRQKTIQRMEDGRHRVRLELQDEILGQYRVLVENDRLLARADLHASELQEVPIPVLETGRTDQCYVTLEEAGRDELEILATQNLQPLNRQQSEWRRLAGILGEGITRAFLAGSDAAPPRLNFRTIQHATVQTVGAQIGLAETFLIIDPHGAYRGRQTWHVNNTTEQFLEVRLPESAELWTASVAGEPVRPAGTGGARRPELVRIPLIKTAEGDPDYPVVLKYGGQLASLAPVAKVNFPLIHTVNIRVELSRVRLRLPESFHWFHFGGTMRQVFDEGEFQADFFQYNTRQVRRLMQIWNSENPYARARVANTMKQLGLAVHSYHDSYSGWSSSESFRSNYSANTEALARAQQETEQYFEQAAREAGPDNRDRLNQFFHHQYNSLARNVVTDLDGNFRTPVQPQEESPQGDEQFRHDWLERNQLERSARYSDSQVADRLQTKTAEKPGGATSARTRGQAVLQDLGEDKKRLPAKDATPEPGSGGRLLQTQQDLARQYQQQLAAESAQPDAQTPYAGPQSFETPPLADARTFPFDDDFDSLHGRLAGAAPEPADFGDQAHLASLDVALPERGVEFLFTTPRGDIQIVGRAIARPLANRWLRLLGIAAAAIAGAACYRAARCIGPQFNTTAGCILLILSGLASLVTLTLPLFGLVLLGIGIALLIRRVGIGRS